MMIFPLQVNVESLLQDAKIERIFILYFRSAENLMQRMRCSKTPSLRDDDNYLFFFCNTRSESNFNLH